MLLERNTKDCREEFEVGSFMGQKRGFGKTARESMAIN